MSNIDIDWDRVNDRWLTKLSAYMLYEGYSIDFICNWVNDREDISDEFRSKWHKLCDEKLGSVRCIFESKEEVAEAGERHSQ